MFSGSSYRRELKILKENNDPNYNALKKAYDNLKKENGKEYLDGNGEVFDPKTGDFFQIDDPSKLKPGVVLRQQPTVEYNPQTDNTAVFDGAVIEITGDPIDVLGYDLLKSEEISKRMFPVKVLIDSPYFDTPDEAHLDQTGYISQEYLGNKMQVEEWK